ncbi:hypothetical protein ACEQPO_10955 [Bacillus sp. SL00103]
MPKEEVKAIEKNAEESSCVLIYRRFTGGYAFEPQIVKAMDPMKRKKGTKKLPYSMKQKSQSRHHP